MNHNGMPDGRRVRTAGRVLAGVVAAASLTLAGCSSGDSWPSAGSSPATPTPTPAPTSAAAAPVGAAPDGSDDGTGTGRGSSGDGPGGGPGTGPSGGRCTTGELRGSLGAGDGAAGSVNQTLILTNVGKRTCSLRGFPGVSYVGGDNGAQVGRAASMAGPRGGDVTIRPGGSVGADMRLANTGMFDPAQCRPTPVRGLRVYPPGDTASLFVPREGTGCAGDIGANDQISVQTVKPR